MININLIKDELLSAGILVDFIMQYSYNPETNDAIQFYVYSKSQLSHIVSTYRKQSIVRNKIQNKIMSKILQKLDNSEIRDNIVFSDWLVQNQYFNFRIQKYIKHQNLIFRQFKDFEKYVNISSEWIIQFQNKTMLGSVDQPEVIKDKVKNKLMNIKSKYPNITQLSELIPIIISNLYNIVTPMRFAMHHGDYFYGNYFIDIENKFRIIDWEFAKKDEWVVIDPFFNLINIYQKLQKINKVNSLHNVLNNPSNKYERLLNLKFKNYTYLYGITQKEVLIYLSYILFVMYFREYQSNSKVHLFPFLKEIKQNLQEFNI